MEGRVKVTYIEHSGFLVETKSKYLLFDYYKGNIPQMEVNKPLYVFASHVHGDHFVTKIFDFLESNQKVHYLLSYDIKMKPGNMTKWKLSQEALTYITSIKACETYLIDDIKVESLKSTDAGVAFLIRTDGMTIYHAGDLNWWYWEEESKEWKNNMEANFKREINKMKDRTIDIAFMLLDSRQEEYNYLGMEYLLQKADVKYIFPMHMWGDYSGIQRFKEEKMPHIMKKEMVMMDIKEEGQEFTLP
ncbi:MBL fold metallo-hydrolase [Lachnospiraceae bacterium OttesenSCG-928-D06]|nr:MBL fold metallo-hydrolase [Lachnospiraceae bacterium OttesenSCG-928-D06]